MNRDDIRDSSECTVIQPHSYAPVMEGCEEIQLLKDPPLNGSKKMERSKRVQKSRTVDASDDRTITEPSTIVLVYDTSPESEQLNSSAFLPDNRNNGPLLQRTYDQPKNRLTIYSDNSTTKDLDFVPTKNNFCIRFLKYLCAGSISIFMGLLSTLKQIYNLLTMENLKKFPFELTFLLIYIIIYYKCFSWLGTIQNNIQTDFNISTWYLINALFLAILAMSFLVSVGLRALGQKCNKAIYSWFSFVMVFYCSCVIYFVYTYYEIIEKLYYENKF